MEFAPVYPYIYRLLKPRFPSCLWSGGTGKKVIALTFDDGPHPLYTPKLLEVLARYQVKATFFCLGISVERFSSLAGEIAQQGHGIGIHGYLHHNFPLLSTKELEESLAKTSGALSSATGLDLAQIRDVRPPNGVFTPRVLNQLQLNNYRPVMWSVVPEDWVQPGISLVVKRIMSQVHNGAVIVLHDGYYGGQDVAATVSELIPQLLQKGYSFLTIDQMWQTLS